ncbi:MAG: carbohydrate kinase family protein [Anaerolineae bacterium]|nr:carbohydrate kinase family protein [Anaerolineae bacterium]
MGKILVAGLTNIETTLRVDSFPIHYSPVHYPFFGIRNSVSGVGYNVAKALTTLGDSIHFLSMTGRDTAQKLVKQALSSDGIRSKYIIDGLNETPQSVVIYDRLGNRQVNVDLKDIQDRAYPQVLFEQALADCSVAVLCNVNFTRPFLETARRAGKIIATDVHAIGNMDDEYNRDYMSHADILFMSHEALPCSPEDWARWLIHRYGTEIAVIGLGADGALLSVRRDNFLERVPPVYIRPIVNTIGAGDALFSAFVHYFNRSHNPYDAIRRAMIFASYKIGETGASEGFLTQAELDQLVLQVAV